ncbi:MAG: endolytic transglycosylase MltG [Spirochaetes bacterium]|nr:endolytic transglycosylase MltG [Spirochaetota bacterium]
MRKSLIVAAALLLLTVISCSTKGKAESRDEYILFAIKPGSSAKQVAGALAEAKLISNKTIFLIRLRLIGIDKRLEAGTYRFRKGSRMRELLSILAEDKVATAKVTIPEGSTLSTIASALDKAEVTGKSDFLMAARDPELLKRFHIPGTSFEGFLFPDTYDLSLGSEGVFVIEIMAKRFFESIAKLSFGAAADPETLFENVILASIVEREYRVAEEAPLIASVFRNRLKIGMALQSCATIVYVLTERQGKPHPSIVYFKDLDVDDPYNTYRHRGLPPGPISNPGATALASVFSPEKSEYLYFRLSDESRGTHRFSKTFDEHRDTAIPVKGL